MSVLTRTGRAPRPRHRRAGADVVPVQPLVVVAGCHGGAGATTVAALLQPAIDIGVVTDWPRYAANRGFAGRPLVLVARGTVQAVAVAGRVTAAARTAHVHPAGLVVVADGPLPEPRGVTQRLRLLAAHTPVHRLPYVTRWRYVADPLRGEVPTPLAAAVTVTRSALSTEGDTHP
ncbi:MULTISPECIES: hypothetical protein [Protofrankia]|uniref:hypothetical protein n=1 Tax=Protofrankia TaxID=2994361 RepID=UPI00069BA6F7|nr:MULTISPECIES: hypothetical protein [Protofrankia]ONH33429.1 hypothetical protein BL254_19920 [Protofrankia sp. BMG5.30]